MSENQITSTEFQDQVPPVQQPEPANQPEPTQAKSKFNANFFERTRTTIYMIVGFMLIIGAGQFYSILFIQFLNMMIFSEVNSLKRNEEKEIKIPMTKFINWYFFLVFNYFGLGKFIAYKLPYLGIAHPWLGQMLAYHSFITFCLFIVGFLSFVLSLKHGFLKYQFRLFGWIMVALSIVTTSAWAMCSNVSEGMLWFIAPAFLIICNDIFAYLFGYFFGRHPLIALSPKKTWEGYLGGALSTVVFSVVFIEALQTVNGLSCPMTTLTFAPFSYPSCTPPFLDTLTLGPLTITQLQAHFMIFSLFASFIGPFGGFFASGVKRSIKIKDFGNSIPGHGGVSDRMDCQVIMGSFVYFYHQTFLKVAALGASSYIISLLSPKQQLTLYHDLSTSLTDLKMI